jgi:hypothetical protein
MPQLASFALGAFRSYSQACDSRLIHLAASASVAKPYTVSASPLGIVIRTRPQPPSCTVHNGDKRRLRLACDTVSLYSRFIPLGEGASGGTLMVERDAAPAA